VSVFERCGWFAFGFAAGVGSLIAALLADEKRERKERAAKYEATISPIGRR
jgi:hypothetical protein